MANSQGYTVSQSMWALDAVEDFTTAPIYTSANSNSGAAGELQNDYSQCYTSTQFSSSFSLACSAQNVESYPLTISQLNFGARLYQPTTYLGGGDPAFSPDANALKFGQYATGPSGSGPKNAYAISAWFWPQDADYGVSGGPPGPATVPGLNIAKKFNIVSFLSSDHLRPSTPTPGTCSVQLYLTSSGVSSNLQVGLQTIVSSSGVAIIPRFEIYDSVVSSLAVNTEEWNHVLVCYDATTPGVNSAIEERVKMYLNGNLSTFSIAEVSSTLAPADQPNQYTGSYSPFFATLNASTGAIGNDASYNTDISTLTGSGIGIPDDQFFINNVYEGWLNEVSIFNYSLATLDSGLPALIYNNGCPPNMQLLPIFNEEANRPIGYYKMGGLHQPLFGPPNFTNEIIGDTAGSASWAAWSPPMGPPSGARLQNAVPALWGDDNVGDLNYAMGDGYPVRDVNDGLVGVANIYMELDNDIPGSSIDYPCENTGFMVPDGYPAPDKRSLIASPIYNRKHSLGSIYSVSQFGWSFPKNEYPNSPVYTDRTLTMSIPETSASFNTLINQNILGGTATTWLVFNPFTENQQGAILGNIQTCGGNAEWESGPLAGSTRNGLWVSSSQAPSYDSYDDYNQYTRLVNKDYSVIPEFLISDQIEYYLGKQRGDFLAPNPTQFCIKGSSTSSISDIPSNSSEDAFYETFSNSDFLRNFSVIKQDHKGFADPSTITLKCRALIKFLPYDGFFPSERSLQIANQFSKSYGDFVEYSGLDSSLSSANFRPFLTPFFRPGIVYNTIKSGLAVDFPIYTSSYNVIRPVFCDGKTSFYNVQSPYYLLGTQEVYRESLDGSGSSGTGSIEPLFSASWDFRIPFEAAVEPEKYVQNIKIYDLEPNPDSAIDIQARWTGEGDVLYKRMMHNYLAAIPEFWLPNGEFTNLKSKPESEFLTVQSGTSYGMRVKVRRTMNKPRYWRNYSNPDPIINYEIPQDPRALIGEAQELKETFTMYSRPSAFGPPVAGNDFFGFRSDGDDGVSVFDMEAYLYNTQAYPSDSLMGINPSFTPPYYGRNSWVDIVYESEKTGKVTLDEILAQVKTNYWALDTNPILTGQTSSISASIFGNDRQQAIWSTTEESWSPGSEWDEDGTGASPMRVSYANAYAMQINASFNLFNKNEDVWVIEPKFETPHYNFNSDTSIRPLASASNTLTIPTNGSESVPRGIWHQFGTIEPRKGIYIDIEPIPEEWRLTRGYADPNRVTNEWNHEMSTIQACSFKTELMSGIDLSIYQNDKFEDLSSVVGFEESKKLGNTADSLTVSEAVVAVPFILEDGEKKFLQIPEDVIRRALGDLNTIESDKAASQAGLAVKAALKGLDENKGLLGNLPDQKAANVRAAAAAAAAAASSQLDRDEDTSDKVSETIKDMVSKMKKFVFPPNMDFVTNLGKVTPFSMYIFEFDYQFTQTDLAYMWQNVAPPNRGTKFDQKEVQISHKLYANELMGSFGNGENDPIPDGLQWMVFKVKQRANNNYFSKVSQDLGPKQNQFPVSYNWPYDFFSLVEFANMDAKVGFGDGLKDGSVDQRVAEVKENPLKVAKKPARSRRKGKKK